MTELEFSRGILNTKVERAIQAARDQRRSELKNLLRRLFSWKAAPALTVEASPLRRL